MVHPSESSRLRRWSWFIGLWLAGVCAVFLLAMFIRLFIA